MVESKVLDALFPGARRILLGALFGEPDRWWLLEELAGCAGVRPGSQQAYLARLRKAGIVRERKDGGAIRFQPDPDCPIFAELRAIVVKLTHPSVFGETILVVEDTEGTAQITRILLESWGYIVLEAHDATEAPGMSGMELADELRRRRPRLPAVFMSGYSADQFSGPGDAYLPKPFNPWSLSQMVRKTLDGVSSRARRINTP